MKRKLMAILAAFAACLAGTAMARTITVTENKTDDVTTSFDLTFSAESADTTNTLWMAWGWTDGGAECVEDWRYYRNLGTVAGDVTSMSNVPVPSGWGETVSHLRFFLTPVGTSSSDAIPGAERLEYIKATGTQYIRTDYTPTGTARMEGEFALDDTTIRQFVFMARPTDSDNTDLFRLAWMGDSNPGTWTYGYQTTSKDSTSPAADTGRYTFISDWQGAWINGVQEIATGLSSSCNFTAGSSLHIFVGHWGIRGGNPIPVRWGKFRLYSFKSWADGSDDSSLALDLVPCRKDGVACLYDRKSGTFLMNAGSGSFEAGSVVETGWMADASSLVTTMLPGWMTTRGAFYPYVYPLYIADIAASNSIDEVTFQKIDSVGAAADAVSYADFVGSARTGTIVKRGDGTLTFNQDISTFTGPVHVEDGVAIGVCAKCFGATDTSISAENRRTYVHSGATLVMDAVGNLPADPENNAVYYEGDGHPGMGGAYVFRNGDTARGTSSWQPGVSSRAVGPTRLYVDFPSGGIAGLSYNPESDFSLEGQDVLMYGRTVGSQFSANPQPIKNIGNLVVSNMTMLAGGTAGELQAKNGSASTIRFCGGSRWIWYSTFDQTGQTATTFVDDMEYAQIGRYNGNGYGIDPWGADGATKRNWYYGLMVLNNHFRLRNYDVRNRSGCTFAAKVGGNGGFRPYQNYGRKTRINLLNDNNDFKGGIVLNEGALGVYGAKAVPSHEGAGLVSITNGYVYFGRKVESASVTNAWVDFTMPITEFVNNGAVTNGTGVFQGLVKKGTGTLDYNSQMGGDYLDLQGGTVKFNTQYRDAYTGDNASATPDGYEPALPVFTTLKGTEGTLDLSDAGGSWTVANIEGSPAVSGNLTVTGNWTVDAAAIGNNVANISGTLTFGEGATITVSGDPESVQRPQGGFVIARAASISGLPRLVIDGKSWTLQARDGELRLTKTGLILFVR